MGFLRSGNYALLLVFGEFLWGGLLVRILPRSAQRGWVLTNAKNYRLPIAVLFVLFLGMAVRASEFQLNQSEGFKDGRASIVILPLAGDKAPWVGGDYPEEFGNPAGLEVHLVPEDEPSRELIYGSGEWFTPPPNRFYRGWLEGDFVISPYSFLFNYSEGAQHARGKIYLHGIGPAGRVGVPPTWKPQAGTIVRLISISASIERLPELSRRLHASAIGPGIQMPLGKALASLWSADGQMVALSRPFEVKSEGLNYPPFDIPVPGSTHLLVLVEGKLGQVAPEVALKLQANESTYRPAVVFTTSARIYATWYDVPAGSVEISATSDGASGVTTDSVRLEAGRLVRHVLRLGDPE